MNRAEFCSTGPFYALCGANQTQKVDFVCVGHARANPSGSKRGSDAARQARSPLTGLEATASAGRKVGIFDAVAPSGGKTDRVECSYEKVEVWTKVKVQRHFDASFLERLRSCSVAL